ncbi:MAG: pantetheine-phosphate adenylyltransferase [Sphaerochaetaceae bacterium]|nr:pantetheine-phosphate adenylyltransferase [Sphaerochaetaceae bacterium]MDC7248232.1 pantetheine-phosphate adenylyltransferase [Sphaerochaetaceae bacterium]
MKQKEVRAILPGTFDPPTNGHINLIERSSKLFGHLDVVVADNIHKKCLFTATERLEMLQELVTSLENVDVVIHSGLIVDYAKEHNIDVMVRGVRALVDFGYEFELAMTNKQLYAPLEVVFLPTDPKFFVLRSSAIKEMAAFGADISKMVPENVSESLTRRVRLLT